MTPLGLIWPSSEILQGCSCCGELKKGERVKITLDGVSQLWPTHLVAETYDVERTKEGRIYKFKIFEEDLNGGPVPQSCNMTVSCYTEVDELRDELLTIVDSSGSTSEIYLSLYERFLSDFIDDTEFQAIFDQSVTNSGVLDTKIEQAICDSLPSKVVPIVEAHILDFQNNTLPTLTEEAIEAFIQTGSCDLQNL